MNEEQRKKVMETATIEEVVISGKDIAFVKEHGFIPYAVEAIHKKTDERHIFDILDFWHNYEKKRMGKNEFVKKMIRFSEDYKEENKRYYISESKKECLLEWANKTNKANRVEKCFDDYIRNDINKEGLKTRLHSLLDDKHGIQAMREYFQPEWEKGNILKSLSFPVFNKEFPNVIDRTSFFKFKKEVLSKPFHHKTLK